MDLTSSVQRELNIAAAKEGITVIHVAECSSRAWGFAAPNSDHDLRFVYIKDPASVKLQDSSDTLRLHANVNGREFDMQGFELAKFMRSLTSSSLTAFETLYSPLIYAEETETTLKWKDIFNRYYNPVGLMDACRGQAKRMVLARGNKQPLETKTVLHILRFALMAKRVNDGHLPELELLNLLPYTDAVFDDDYVKAILEARKEDCPYSFLEELYGTAKILLAELKPMEAKWVQKDDAYFERVNKVYQHLVWANMQVGMNSRVMWSKIPE